MPLPEYGIVTGEPFISGHAKLSYPQDCSILQNVSVDIISEPAGAV